MSDDERRRARRLDAADRERQRRERERSNKATRGLRARAEALRAKVKP
jgi:hypothetical protein